MEQYRIRITRQAKAHLLEIRRYIEKELLSPIAAKNTIAAIKAEIQSLSNMPGRVHLTPEEPWHSSGVRRSRVKNFYIYFWIDEEGKTVQIISVIYVKRDQARQLEWLDME
jgi:plasmid stabilization system protein ParE